jgi:hypothetical protein
LNPIRAKIVSDLTELSRYPYCGHSVLMGKKKRDWQDVKYVLAKKARKGTDLFF